MTPALDELAAFTFAWYPDCPTLRIFADGMIYTVHAPQNQQRDGPVLNFEVAYLQRLKVIEDQRKADLAAAEEAAYYERISG